MEVVFFGLLLSKNLRTLDEANDANTLVFKLDVACTKTKPEEINHNIVTSGDLQWVPEGDQLALVWFMLLIPFALQCCLLKLPSSQGVKWVLNQFIVLISVDPVLLVSAWRILIHFSWEKMVYGLFMTTL